MKGKNVVIATALVVCLTGPWATCEVEAKERQDSSRLIDAVLECDRYSAITERLECYDAAARGIREARARNESIALDSRSEGKPAFKDISSTISAVAPLEPGKWLLVLEDRSVWQTMEEGRQQPRVKDIIVIRKGALSGLRATIDGQRPIQIRRMR